MELAQTLQSSVPGIYEAMFNVIGEAAGEQEREVRVFPYELKQYEPAAYVLIKDIKGPRYEWESIGYYAQREIYSIHGRVSLFSGDAGIAVAIKAMKETFAVFTACVMNPIISGRDEPMLGTTGPSPQILLPEDAEFNAGVGIVGTGPGGWETTLDWGFHFEAVLTPE